MYVKFTVKGKKYEIWGVRSWEYSVTSRKTLMIYTQKDGLFCADGGKVIESFVCDVPFSYTSEETRAILW